MAKGTLGPLPRGALVGLMLGLFGGGLVLMALGGRNIAVAPDCAHLSPVECADQRELLISMARRQVLTGGALAMMGVALFMFSRGSLKGGRR